MTVYTITHEISGAIRINQPYGSVLTFSNASYLAEMHVQSIAENEDHRKTERRIRDCLNSEKVASTEATALRDLLLKIINEDVPF